MELFLKVLAVGYAVIGLAWVIKQIIEGK